jgi:hypothetical protein
MIPGTNADFWDENAYTAELFANHDAAPISSPKISDAVMRRL